jgi:hypothetical protein
MREKRIVCLAKAGFWQLLFIGFGGGAVSEFINGNIERVILAITCSVIAMIYIIEYYRQAKKLSQKTKKKDYDD